MTTAIVADILSAESASADEIAARQAERLVALLRAASATRRYRRLLHGRDPEHLPLSALPPSDKAALMHSFGDGVGDHAITLEGLRAFCADARRVAERFLGRYWVWESSGSTGTPGIFVQDEAAMAVYDALEVTRRASPRPWARLVDPLCFSERFAFVGATGGHFASNVSVQRLRRANPWLALSSRCFSILQPTAELVAQLDAFAPSILATYPTAAVLLSDEAASGRMQCRPQEVWTGGETLSRAMRTRIEQAFGCALRNSYGASEFLPIAWECNRGRLHVNADWVILEPVDAQLRPVPAGQVSHTTLLTNLANHVQPLIRFDIGDSIALGGQRCPCGSALPVVQVQGRSDDVLSAPGRYGRPIQLLPLALTTLLEDEAGVFDFQLRQTGARRWCMRLGPGAAHTAALRRRCRQLLADFAAAQGAVDVHIEVRCVDHALPLGRSGKLQRIVAPIG